MVPWGTFSAANFSIVQGRLAEYRSSPKVTRGFCAECGTHVTTRPTAVPGVVLKVGTLDDPKLFGTAQMAIYTVDKQAFHQIPEGVPAFERLPQR